MFAFRHHWKPRGIRVHGVADAITRQGRFAFGTYIRVKPRGEVELGDRRGNL